MVAPRKYPDELRERAVRLVFEAQSEPGSAGKNVCKRIGGQLGINPETLRGWVKQAEIDGGLVPGTTTDQVARVAELEREVRELRRSPPRLKAKGMAKKAGGGGAFLPVIAVLIALTVGYGSGATSFSALEATGDIPAGDPST